MNTQEKIALILIALFLIVILALSYHELEESPRTERTPSDPISGFDLSYGNEFKIGPFATVVNEKFSGGVENNCSRLRPVIMGALHDIAKRLEARERMSGLQKIDDSFEVNAHTLDVFCNQTAQITLADMNGNQLLLDKAPFERAKPAHSTNEDIGTTVHINATLIPLKKPASTTPDTYGEILIPDRFLDTATSSSL